MNVVEAIDLIEFVNDVWPEYPVFPLEPLTDRHSTDFYDTKFGIQATAWRDVLEGFSLEECRAAVVALAVALPEMPSNPIGGVYRQVLAMRN